jgi:GTP-binding protein
MTFTLAIVGRPNVGKSTLFNRLTGTRHAIVDDTPGVTRDWREGKGNLGPLEFTVIDTAGWEYAPKETLQARMVEMTQAAAEQADMLLMVVDGRAGITATDRDIAKRIRKFGKPVALCVNKAESKLDASIANDAMKLGFGEPAAISAEHGEGLADLYSVVEGKISSSSLMPSEEENESAEESDEKPLESSPMHIAIVGRPNAGKSTLMNALLGKERVLTGPEAGITRDAIASDFTYRGQPIKLVDTAGMRKRSNVQAKIEKAAVSDAVRVIKYAHVVVVLLDAQTALEKQDLTIASLVESEGRGLVIAINKWDLVKNKEEYMETVESRIKDVLPQIKSVPILTISALQKKQLHKVLDASLEVYKVWNSKLGTGELNRWLEKAVTKHTPPMVNGIRLKIKYMTQTKIRPPAFQLFVNKANELPESYSRYLINNMRDHFNLPGIPIRFVLKKSKNPYDKGK